MNPSERTALRDIRENRHKVSCYLYCDLYIKGGGVSITGRIWKDMRKMRMFDGVVWWKRSRFLFGPRLWECCWKSSSTLVTEACKRIILSSVQRAWWYCMRLAAHSPPPSRLCSWSVHLSALLVFPSTRLGIAPTDKWAWTARRRNVRVGLPSWFDVKGNTLNYQPVGSALPLLSWHFSKSVVEVTYAPSGLGISWELRKHWLLITILIMLFV